MAKSIRYKQDGSGRDTYAVCGDGGFTNPDKSSVAIDPRVAFARSLRGYNPDSDYAARRDKRMAMRQKKHMRNYSNIIGSPGMASDLRGKNQMAMPTAEFRIDQFMDQSYPMNGGSDRKAHQLNNMLKRQAILQQSMDMGRMNQDRLEPIRANAELDLEGIN